MKKFTALALLSVITLAIGYAGFHAIRGADTPELIYREPHRLTGMKLRSLQQDIDSVVATTGQLPTDIDSVLTKLSPRDRSYWSHDAWGRAIHFRPAADGYVLISAGADGTYGTQDDIVLTGPQR